MYQVNTLIFIFYMILNASGVPVMDGNCRCLYAMHSSRRLVPCPIEQYMYAYPHILTPPSWLNIDAFVFRKRTRWVGHCVRWESLCEWKSGLTFRNGAPPTSPSIQGKASLTLILSSPSSHLNPTQHYSHFATIPLSPQCHPHSQHQPHDNSSHKFDS